MSSSITFFYFAGIVLYLIATFFFGATVRDKHSKVEKGRAGKIGIVITIIGFISHIIYFIIRWVASGHAPVSNMFEYVTFLGISIVLAFLILYAIYRSDILGLFALPIALMILGFAAMFPTEISPLVPSLQSPWLYIHVTTVSLSQGILAISFVAALIYLIAKIDQSKRSTKTTWLEIVIFSLFLAIGFVISVGGFSLTKYDAQYEYTEIVQGQEQVQIAEYKMPPIIGVQKSKNPVTLTEDRMTPLVSAPEWMRGADSARKLNTVLWSTMVGGVVYLLTRLIIRKRVGAFSQRFVKNVNLEMVDELTYRSVSIGFPLFTLGGLIFASIWAQIAWNRFWGWDPKEVWALITWFFYAAFLHLRLSRGWHGERSAWLAVIGFMIIMFNIIVVNLVLAGLHSYA